MGEIVFLVSDQAEANRCAGQQGGHSARRLVQKKLANGAISLRTIDWRWLSSILGGIAILAILLILLSGRRSKKRFAK